MHERGRAHPRRPGAPSRQARREGDTASVEFILALFAEGWTQTQVLESYPILTADSLQAVFAFAAETLREEPFVGIWKDRDDLSDATAWVRRLREQEWRK